MGIDNLIRAMAPVAERVADARLYIAGDGPLREGLEKLILELGLSANIRLLGRIPGEDLVSWYQAADYSVVPTMTLEGFGLVTTEALACGTPVLGTPFGGTKEILEGLSPELLFADRTPEAMARKLTDVLLGVCRLPSREACREYVLKHYTWQRVAAQVTEIFEHAVDARGRHVHYEGSFL
jgi:glycosyltransferase involved in cell wall biosynthesis